MSDIQLIVGGRKFSSWESVSVTRSLESLSGSFALAVVNRADMPIREEDPCRVEIDDEVVIDGFVERRGIQLDANQHSVTFTGYDRAQALVANSALLSNWTFKATGLLAMAQALAEPFGVKVSLATGLILPPPPAKVVVNPGDSPYQAIVREAANAGALLVSDGKGGLLITQGGRARAAAIVEGRNLLSGSADYDGSNRYHRYVVLASRPGSDTSSGQATRVRAEAIDADVRRTDRVKVIRPSTKMTAAQAQAHADWQARTRAAQAEAITVSVHRWRQPNNGRDDGPLWQVNQIVSVRSPRLGVDGDLLISQATYSKDNSKGEVVQMRLVRPDAYTPDPGATVRGSAKWKQ